MDDLGRCELRADCPNEAAYLITYEDEMCPPCKACVSCTATARSTDPLDYIESIRSI